MAYRCEECNNADADLYGTTIWYDKDGNELMQLDICNSCYEKFEDGDLVPMNVTTKDDNGDIVVVDVDRIELEETY